jgi:hypothetical protein
MMNHSESALKAKVFSLPGVLPSVVLLSQHFNPGGARGERLRRAKRDLCSCLLQLLFAVDVDAVASRSKTQPQGNLEFLLIPEAKAAANLCQAGNKVFARAKSNSDFKLYLVKY